MAELNRESVATTRFSSESRDRENLQKILERKVDLAVRGEREAQQKMYQAEAGREID